jgi:hypothetical protein
LIRFSSRRRQVAACDFQVVVTLKIHPELRTIAEIEPQPKRRVGGNTPPIVDDVGNAVRRNPNGLGKLVLRQAIFCQEFFLEHLTRRDRGEFLRGHHRLH